MTYAGNKQLNISGRHWLQRLLAGLLAMVLAVGCLPVAARSTETETDPTEYTEATDPSETTEATDPSETTEATDPSETTEATDPTAATDSTEPAVIDGGDTPDYSGDVEKYATLNPDYGDYIVVLDITPDETWETYGDLLLYLPEDFSEDACFEVTGWKVVSVTYSDYDDEGSEYSYTSQSLWYQVSVVEGTAADFADGYWILQNFLNEEDAYEQDVLILTDPPEDPSEPTDPTDPPVLEDEENGTGITVSAESFPDGAELEAQDHSATVESDAGIYDIKVYRTDEEGNRVEWQPIDDGQTVEISIPVPGVEDGEYVDILHFVDYVKDIDGDELIANTTDLPEEWLTILQPAIDAYEKKYGDRNHVAVEFTQNLSVQDGAVCVKTDSFSVYTPDYVKQEVSSGESFTVTFESFTDQEDPANEKTYYATIDETVKFKTTWDQGENWEISTLEGSATETVENKDSGTYTTGNLLEGTLVIHSYSSCTVTFDAEGIQPGDIFQIDWTTDRWYNGKNPRWTRVMIVGEYTTTFKVNGGQWEDGTTTDLVETIISQEPVSNFPTPTRPGYKFLGWSTIQAATTADYVPTGNFPMTLTQGGTLYAVWEAAQYSVTYVVPDAVSNQAEFISQIKYHDIDLPLIQTLPEDIDPITTVFKGWDITGDGVVDITPEVWKQGYTYTENADLILVSIWDASVYAVIYNANGGDSVPDTQYLNTTDPTNTVTLAGEATKAGYKFLGWNTAADGSGTNYAVGDVLDKDHFSGNSITLYAQWEHIYYAVRFNSNSGSGTMGDMTMLTYDNLTGTYWYTNYYANLTKNAFSLSGKKFIGWALSADDANDGIVQFTDGQNVKMSTFLDLDGVEPTGPETLTVSYNDAEHKHDHMIITLYAVWVDATYTIKYLSNQTNDDSSVSISSLTQTLIVRKAGQTINSQATKSRHTFVGWKNLDETDTTEYYPYNGTVPDGVADQVISLYPVWKYNIVAYMCEMVNGSPVLQGSVQIGDQTNPDIPAYLTRAMDESDGTYPDMIFTIPTGFQIKEVRVGEDVRTDNEGQTGSYTYNEKSGENITAPLFVAVILERRIHKVYWLDHDGETVLETDENVTYGETATYDGETPTRVEDDSPYLYTFSSWEFDRMDEETCDVYYKASFNETLKEYTVTFYDSDGTTVWNTQTVTHGSAATAPTENPTKDGFTFTGWDQDFSSVISSMEIYPEFEQNPSKVTITWDYLCFDFSKSSGWDPTTHLYSNIPALDGSDTHNSVTVKVEQFASTDASIGVSIRYDSLAAYSMITGVFSVDDGANTSAKVETGEATLDDDKTSVTFYLWLSGSMEPPAQNEDVQVGNCYITLTSNYKIETDVYKSEGE